MKPAITQNMMGQTRLRVFLYDVTKQNERQQNYFLTYLIAAFFSYNSSTTLPRVNP